MLPNVSSHDLGSPAEPGEYVMGEASVRVERPHLEVWRDQPEAVFRTILCTRAGDASTRFVLGSRLDD